MKKKIETAGAPAPIGPYSQGIAASGSFLFVAGQTAKDPVSGVIPKGVKAQTERCLLNIKAIVEAAGATMADVVRVGVFMKDLDNFAVMNEVYASFFSAPFPARTTVGASLPGGPLEVEIDAVVHLPK